MYPDCNFYAETMFNKWHIVIRQLKVQNSFMKNS
jgi:hypothetical protein